MQWNRSETIGLAKVSCAHCLGYGIRRGRWGKEQPCSCVFRAVFRACYARFRDCVGKERHISTISLDWSPGSGKRFYSRKTEEYIADFCLVSRRMLDDADYRIFKFHYLLRADWRLCCRRLEMSRGDYFHALYRIQNTLGRTFRELEPYPLFPLDEYFCTVVRKPPASNCQPTRLRKPQPKPVRKPVRKPARKPVRSLLRRTA